MMAHFAPIAPSTPKPFISTFSRKTTAHLASPTALDQGKNVQRRNVALGLAGVVLGLSIGSKDAEAAARRPPPPPSEEKKDPNVTGLAAKVLASKKRKEAMKETIAKLRERGKSLVPSQ